MARHGRYLRNRPLELDVEAGVCISGSCILHAVVPFSLLNTPDLQAKTQVDRAGYVWAS